MSHNLKVIHGFIVTHLEELNLIRLMGNNISKFLSFFLIMKSLFLKTIRICIIGIIVQNLLNLIRFTFHFGQFVQPMSIIINLKLI